MLHFTTWVIEADSIIHMLDMLSIIFYISSAKCKYLGDKSGVYGATDVTEQHIALQGSIAIQANMSLLAAKLGEVYVKLQWKMHFRRGVRQTREWRFSVINGFKRELAVRMKI